jgi:hypothetical protein
LKKMVKTFGHTVMGSKHRWLCSFLVTILGGPGSGPPFPVWAVFLYIDGPPDQKAAAKSEKDPLSATWVFRDWGYSPSQVPEPTMWPSKPGWVFWPSV